MKCKKDGCHNEVTVKGMVFCSRDCAPYGNYCLGHAPPQRKKHKKIVVDKKSDVPEWLQRFRQLKKT